MIKITPSARRTGLVSVLAMLVLCTVCTAQDSLGSVQKDFAAAMKSGMTDKVGRDLSDRCLKISATTKSGRLSFNGIVWVFHICNQRGVEFETAKELRGKALDRALEKFPTSSRMREILSPYLEAVDRRGEQEEFAGYFDRIEAANKDKVVRALCLAIRADHVLARMERGSVSDADRAGAIGHLKKLIADYGDVEDPGGRPFSRSAGPKLAQLENPVTRHSREMLAVGKAAPEIEGRDLDGTPFKLSDYKGKVVVLDFWGHW